MIFMNELYLFLARPTIHDEFLQNIVTKPIKKENSMLGCGHRHYLRILTCLCICSFYTGVILHGCMHRIGIKEPYLISYTSYIFLLDVTSQNK